MRRPKSIKQLLNLGRRMQRLYPSGWPGNMRAVLYLNAKKVFESGNAPETDFIFTVLTTSPSETFTIPCTDIGTFNATVNWGDGGEDAITAYNDAALTHTYATAGTHTITVSGTFPSIRFNNGGDRLKVTSVLNLGVVGWLSLERAFYGCTNLATFTVGNTDVSGVTIMQYAFRDTTFPALDVSDWDVSSVTNMSFMFQNSSVTALDVSGWDVSNVTSMIFMFRDSAVTTLDVSSWDVSSVTTMVYMFRDSAITALDVSSWDVGLVNNMGFLFYNAPVTVLDVSSWDVSSVTYMRGLFDGCPVTALDVSSWDVSSVTNFREVFRDCPATTIDVSSWDVSSATEMSSFLNGAGLSTAVYDATLVYWDSLTVNSGLTVDFGSSTYTSGGAAETARSSLISNDSWTITDGGAA